MPDVGISIPYPAIDYPIDVQWPLIGQFGAGSAFQPNGNPKYGISTGYAIFSAAVGAGLNNMGNYNNLFCGQFESDGLGATVERTLDGISFYAGLTKNSVGATFKEPYAIRVFRWQVAVALQLGAHITDESGFVLEPAAGVAPGWIKAGNRGMGLVGDGAGHWRYVSKNAAGVGVYSESIVFDGLAGRPAWPAAVTEWALVDFEIIAANGIGDAVFNLYLNSNPTPVISRSWGAGTLLPDYTSPANAARFTPHIRMGDAAVAESLKIGAGMRFMTGANTVSGALV